MAGCSAVFPGCRWVMPSSTPRWPDGRRCSGIWGHLGGGDLRGGLNVLWMPAAASRRAAAFGAIAALFFLGAVLARQNWTQPQGPVIQVAAVQGAVPQDQKWQLKNRALTLDRYMRLTAQAWGASSSFGRSHPCPRCPWNWWIICERSRSWDARTEPISPSAWTITGRKPSSTSRHPSLERQR